MSKVVNLEQFRRRKSGEEPTNKKVESGPTQSPKGKDLSVFNDVFGDHLFDIMLIQNFPEKGAVAERLEKMINSTRSFNPHTLSQMREEVAKYSDKELIGWFTDHPEMEWGVKPALFRAVAEEVARRNHSEPS